MFSSSSVGCFIRSFVRPSVHPSRHQQRWRRRPPAGHTRQHAHPSPPAVFYCFTVTDIKPSRPVHEIRPCPCLSYLLYEWTLVNQVDIYHHEIVISNWLPFCRDYLYTVSFIYSLILFAFANYTVCFEFQTYNILI